MTKRSCSAISSVKCQEPPRIRGPGRLRTAVFYMTDRCVLRCSYCYFRDKGGADLPRAAAGKFLKLLEGIPGAPSGFVISGGEPLLRWKEVCWLTGEVRSRFSGRGVHLQTNGLLLDREKIGFCRKAGMTIEFGIDGDLITTTRHRCGLDQKSFGILVGNIREAVRAGIGVGCTMTVHPDQVTQMASNLLFLCSLGIGHVDVTPAAFMPWDARSAGLFRRNYQKILKVPAFRRKLLVSEDLEPLLPGTMDLSLHPPGDLLGGDAFLCLPREKRAACSLWDSKTGQWRPELLEVLQQAYQALHQRRGKLVYRDLISCNFQFIDALLGGKKLSRDMVPLMRFMTLEHLKQARREGK